MIMQLLIIGIIIVGIDFLLALILISMGDKK